MRLLRLFVEYEAVTQLRSARFRGLAAVYVIAASTPAVATWVAAGRSSVAIGSAAYSTFVLSVQPVLTVLLAAALSADALARERDEGSFSVLSVAPISSAGYLLRRWMAVAALSIPLSFVPQVIAATLAGYTQHRVPQLWTFVAGWLFHVLPPLLATSVLFMALGTITGRTVLSIIFAALMITAGLDLLNSFAMIFHRKFDGPDSLIFRTMRSVQELVWTVRGYWSSRVPSEAAFPTMREMRELLPGAGIGTAVTVALLGWSAFYLRRTRRNLRPWRISETNPVRTLLRTVNRIREEYVPDAGPDLYDRAAFLICLAVAAALVGYLVHLQSFFATRAAERYAAETSTAASTSATIVPQSVRIDAEVNRAGEVRSRSVLTLRNSGPAPQSHLSFFLNSGMAAGPVAVNSGRARANRVWERLDVDLDPPLLANQSRALTFDLAGLPGEIDFSLQYPGNFRGRWERYVHAKSSIYMSDLSRSTIDAAATEVRMQLTTRDLAPVLRYTPWTLRPEGEGFIGEFIAPPATLEVRLRHPYSVVVDSCGSLTSGAAFASRCTTGLPSYVIFGGPFTQTTLTPGATLAYIPAHDALAKTHGPSLASSIGLATQSWPGLTLPPHLVFVEQPIDAQDRYWYYENAPLLAVQQIAATGALFFVPEKIFTRLKAIDADIFAAAVVSSALRTKRAVIPEQAAFFNRFFATVAINRLGGRRTTAVESPLGPPPETDPLIQSSRYYRGQSRMTKVLSAIEYRVGADHFVEGINDFVAAGPRSGTARELLESIGRRGGNDLSRAYKDYFEGTALPKLTLNDVAFRRVGARWEVSGFVTNDGTGEAFVPLVLRTAQGSMWKTLQVDTAERVPFLFSTDSEPRSLQLDPDKVCFRHAAVGTVDSLDYRGGA